MKTKIIGLLLLLSISCGIQALGFKAISVDSLLNEPLDARIELVSIKPTELDGLRVSLANSEAFRKAGLSRPPHLSRLQFKTLVGDNQQAFIHVTTKESVREPFLNFLLEVIWKENVLLREYTVLLDPPSSAVRVADTVPVSGKTGEETKKSGPSQTPRKQPARQYGPVKRTETLWVIASRVRPDNSVSVEQMMMALLEANPDAFQHGNVNFLKRGAVLNIPDHATIAKLNALEARRAFQQQNRDWQAIKSEPAPVAKSEAGPTAVPGEQSEVVSAPEPGSEDEAAGGVKLRVVETGREETESATAAETLASEEVAVPKKRGLSDEIAESKRDLEAVKEINRDLEELKDALELKIEALRKSLEERNRTIDRLEQRLNAVRVESGTAMDAARRTDPVVGEERKKAVSIAAVTEMGRAQTEKKPLAEPAPAESQETDWLAKAEQYWLQIFVVVLLLLILLLILLVRRRRSESHLPDAEAFGSYIDVDSQPVTEERFLNPKGSDKQHKETGSERFAGDFSPSSNADVESALTEADIYLAYRRYGPAEELIRQAIDNHPDSMILKAKLLEIYAFRKDKNKFVAVMEQDYQQMIARAPEIWAKVVEMGRNIAPDHELIAGAALSEEDADTMINTLSFDLDDLADSKAVKGAGPKSGKDHS